MIDATPTFVTELASFRVGTLPVVITIGNYTRAFCNFDPIGFTWNDSIASHVDWLGEMDPITMSVSDLDGGSDTQSWSFTVQDFENLITADFPDFTFEGKLVTVRVGLGSSMSIDDFCTVFVGYVDSVSSVNDNLDYQFNCADTAGLLTKIIFTVGDDGQPTSADHIKTVSGHPLDILLTILGSEVGLATSLYDLAKIEEYRDGPFSGMKMVFHLQQGVAAIDFIKAQIMKPLGGYVWTNGAGVVTVNFFYPIEGPVAIASFSEDTWKSIPSAEQTDMVNTVQMKFDKDDADSAATGNYLAVPTNLYAPSVTKYGQYGEQEIDADGIRSAFQGFFIAALTSRLIFMRYGFKNLKFDTNAADGIFGSLLVEMGDVVSVTHALIPDRSAGVMGITNKLFEILGKTIDLKEGVVTFVMIDASYLQTFGFFLITSDAQADYAAASPTEKGKYMFMTDDSGLYSNSDAGHGLG